jgi:uncharacterized protein
MSQPVLPLLGLFRRLRQVGMLLTIDQYELLRQAMEQGYGLAGWDDLRETCRMLWVKPSVNYDAECFEVEFERYKQQHQDTFQEWMLARQQPEPEELKPEVARKEAVKLGVLPRIPPRVFPGRPMEPQQQTPEKPGKGLVAAKSRKVQPIVLEVPVSPAMVKQTWRSLRQKLPDSSRLAVDLRATVERIGREGAIGEVVQRPVFRKRMELLVLVDDANPMLPFGPVIQPLVEMVRTRQIGPAELFRFNCFPAEYLFDWQRPLQGIPVERVLARLHRQRTVVVIVSDGGAASRTYQDDRMVGMQRFLNRLQPCVQDVLWFNPVPRGRWADTSAEWFSELLGERMVPFEGQAWRGLARRDPGMGVQQWLMA